MFLRGEHNDSRSLDRRWYQREKEIGGKESFKSQGQKEERRIEEEKARHKINAGRQDDLGEKGHNGRELYSILSLPCKSVILLCG